MRIILLFLLVCVSFSVDSRPTVSGDTLDVMIGQMIMMGIGKIDPENLDERIFQAIKEGKVGGVVLYEKNIVFENPKPQLALLVENLQKNAEIPLFVSIDEEGGRVSRMKTRYGFPKNVSAQYLGEIDNLDSTRFYAVQTAVLLSHFGINMNYAPVVDVNLNPENPVIGKIERSYSSQYRKVIRHAAMVVEEHSRNGIVPVLKHFPGHGSSRNDTHLGLTDVTETWQIEEIYPYSALIDRGKVKAIMTAHIVNKSLDGNEKPATLSKRIITGLLRDSLNYDGVIISDDMQMGAINNEYGMRESIRMSIEAGIDMLMFANNVVMNDIVMASTVHAIIKDLIFAGVISRDRIKTSYDRIMKLKAEMGLCDKNYYQSLKNKLWDHN